MSENEDQQARSSLRELVKHVFTHRDGLIAPIYYQDLAFRIGRLTKHRQGHAHGMGRVLGLMGHLIFPLTDAWGNSIPQIQSLVVLRNGPQKDLPDDGIKEFWADYPKMTRTEKENRTRAEYQKIVAFGSRWNDVLTQLGLDTVVVPTTAVDPPAGNAHWGGGESEEHKALKEFVKQHPEIVGASGQWDRFTEYPLPSLDLIDVFFRSGDSCIAVEVKSAVSDNHPKDYERGIFQIVKYRALLEAMVIANDYDMPAQIQSSLVLESQLPHKYRGLAESLNVKVIEDVKVTIPSHD